MGEVDHGNQVRKNPTTRLTLPHANIPDTLKAIPHWVCWRLIQKLGKKPGKVLFQTGGRNARTTDPNTWTTFDNALGAYQRGDFDGIGYVFSPDEPFAGIDLDGVVGNQGSIKPRPKSIVERLNSYTEYSVTDGLHVIVEAKLPPGRRELSDDTVGMFDSGRFFTMTGRHLEGTPLTVENRQDEIETLHAELFPAPVAKSKAGPTHVNMGDSELIDRAFNARNGAAFERLWRGDLSGYSSQSEADMALCAHLAFWAGGQARRVARLFRQSGLMRDKWDEGRGDSTYGDRTIAKVLAGMSEYYGPRKLVISTGRVNSHGKVRLPTFEVGP